jgi:outer membrane protein OmpA-like peptidoglycan-associated protein
VDFCRFSRYKATVMRVRLLWIALIAASFGVPFAPLERAHADDFDDDFAQPVPKPAPRPAPPPPPAAPAPPKPKPKPAQPAPYADFEDGDPPAESPAPTPAQAPAQPAEDAFDEPATSAPAAAQGGLAARADADADGGSLVALEGEAAAAAGLAPDDHYRDDTTPLPHATLYGLVGGIHVVDGGSAPARTFRTSVYGRLFRKDGFIQPYDQHRRLSSVLSIGATPVKHLELAAALSANATENNTGDPLLVQALGDTSLSAKGYFSPLAGLSVSGDMELLLLNGTGGVGFAGGATGVGLRAAASLDLRETRAKKPVVLRSNLRYLFDNSRRLIEDVESGRYDSLGDPSPPEDEYRHLVTAVERYQLQVSRVDTFTLGFGAEFPISIMPKVDIRPIVEWSIALPVNRQNYDCLVSNDPADRDHCLAREGFAARSSDFTLGVRGEPGVRGLSILVGVDIATGGHRTFVRELAPNSRYELIAALSFAYDTRPPKPVVLEKTLEHEPPPRGTIQGLVVDKAGGQPVARAIVHIDGSAISDLASDADGKFASHELEPRAYALTVTHEDYHEGQCSGEVPEPVEGEPQSVSVRCELEPKPRFAIVRGRVSNLEGQPIPGATVELLGPTATKLSTDANGDFASSELAPGSYEARAEAPGYLIRATPFNAAVKQEANLALVLSPVPTERLTELNTKAITIKRQVQFVQNSDEISEKSNALIAEIADLLIRTPELLKVEVGGHADYTGSEDYNKQLSQSRAEAVRSALIAAGVDSSRLTAVGYGRSRPLVPNITEANRARNRRVEFVILEKAK